ncbi:NmrA family NAD(P)-binding protein [Phaeacidiphilus oryzae]|uniref:NmrA family NAD(P)-binding protein n=1 Tax=Phaeacidiphilus oryzae TaxID=348818 RepID=UPI00068B3874|nr:NmrA family NAD(P)-binding protein [Phaeacidiphilus oryzae]
MTTAGRTDPDGPVLVTGAAGGQQGSTGRHVVRILLERGRSVRALVHHEDERAAALAKLGAEVVVGDLREIQDTRRAMRGVRSAYFTYPVTDGLLEATGAFAAAAREEGVQRVVETSQLAADPDAGTPRMRQHWVSEQVFDWAGVGAVHLRAAVFFENLDFLLRAGGEGSELRMPLGPGGTVLPLVAGEDVARVAAGLLGHPRAEPPGSVVLLVGEVLTVGQVVQTYSGFGPRHVRYVDVPPKTWRRQAEAIYRDEHTVDHLDHLWALFRAIDAHHELYHVTPTIETLGGRLPIRLADFVAGG